ncbi:MAG: MBL fold metallo-hydrolase [Chloroflexi bacterium CFX7]|nr:MBL fold metallo-hydrolase [Chloroflexi bacterium CFX7]
MSERFEIVFLGTGSPLPNADRCGAGNVVVAGDTHVLVDCGWGAARRLVPAGVRPASIDVAIFTHMHTDHMTDVPDFLFQRWTGGASTPLRVFGPEGTQEMIDGFLLALRRDIGFRKESFEVDHFPVVPAFGYRVRFDGRSAVLSGDTSFCETLATAAEGADMLVCEAMNAAMLQQVIGLLRFAGRSREAGLLEDVPSYHMPTEDVARLAAQAGVGEVVLSHLIPPIPNDTARETDFMAGMNATYGGRVRVARDMQRIEVSRRQA